MNLICGLAAGVVACFVYGLLRNDPRLIQDEPYWMRELDNDLTKKGL